jgi:hypothetical protein
MSNIPQQWLYYIMGLLLLFWGAMIAGILFAWSFTLPSFIVGGTLSGVGYYLCCLGDKVRRRSIRIPPVEDTIDTNTRNIGIESGVYNEQIQGDSINIQGNQIYIGHDLSKFTDQIKEILNEIKNKGCDAVIAEKQVINELKVQIHENSRIRKKILKWKKQLGVSTISLPNDKELAEIVVKFANEDSSDFSINSIFVVEGRYKKLHDLLEAGKWKEADEETVKVMCNLMPERHYIYIDVDQIPPKDLRTINKLWLKFSNGRFGLSVQHSIWIKILKEYHSNENKYWIDDSVYKVFIDRIGWTRESNRIYHGDLEYSLKAPKGHLPAILMFQNPYYSDCNSNYYYLNKSIFKALMDREYYRIPFIPSWLENWLFIE